MKLTSDCYLTRPKKRIYFTSVVALIIFLISVQTFLGFSPMPNWLPSSSQNAPRIPWLIATVSTIPHLQRRQIIRSTWQRLFRNDTLFETRFILATPDPFWAPLIEQENRTYGDLIVLDHEHEDHLWANRVKTMKFFKHLKVHYNTTWQFVSKMDEDSWIDATNFWRQWLEPLAQSNNTTGTYIGRPMQLWYPFKYASGQFYTLSMDMVHKLAHLHAKNSIDDEHEDVLVGRLLHEAKIQYNVTELPLRAAFDYYDDKTRGDGTAWAREDQDVNVLGHALCPGALNPHLMKSDEDYLRVAAAYDENGLRLEEYWTGTIEMTQDDKGNEI